MLRTRQMSKVNFKLGRKEEEVGWQRKEEKEHD